MSAGPLALTKETLDRIGGAMWGIYIGDAMASPTHWYYGGQSQVRRDYGGPIKGYTKPNMNLSGSIMKLSNTGGAGRGGFSGDIIGEVINHGKKKYWSREGSYHYHCTLAKGENTLEAQLVRVVCRTVTENKGQFSADSLRKKYVEFMTTPGSHNDAYASTCHRMFFANMKNGKPLEKCPDNDQHNVDTIDGLILGLPVALAGSRLPLEEAQRQAVQCTDVTRLSSALPPYVEHVTAVLRQLLRGEKLIDSLKTGSGRSLEDLIDGAARRPDPMVA